MLKKPEILAPAGDAECFRAAINAGADAVYTGGNKFGARAYAGNFEEKELVDAIDFAHLRGAKVYLTVNTLLKSGEIKNDLYDYLAPYYECGLDAVIVQDFGVMQFIHENFPDIDIHASTQAALFTHYSANTLRDEFGITRVVPPRELSFRELKIFRKNTDLEMEVFVHGALCYCCSGRCLMSSMNGKRSGNRGRCAQPCRKEYNLGAAKGFYLSMKDLCSLEYIPELIETGIDSFKIEGRMKKPEYVALCTYLYKKYSKLYVELGSEEYAKALSDGDELRKDIIKLSDIYNRGGFTDGYFYKANGIDMISSDRPNHYGTLVGKTVKCEKNKCSIKLSESVGRHDVLEIRGRDKESTYEFTTAGGYNASDVLVTNISKAVKISPNQPVYRTRNEELILNIRKNIIEKDIKVPVNIRFTAHYGEKSELILYMGDTSVTVRGNIVEKAQNSPLDKERIRQQLCRLGGTSFIQKDTDIIIDDDIFIPIGELNNLRRDAIKEYSAKYLGKYKRHRNVLTELTQKNYIIEDNSIIFHARFGSAQELRHLLDCGIIKYIYVDLNNNIKDVVSYIEKIIGCKKNPVVILPQIIRYGCIETLKKEIKAIINLYGNKIYFEVNNLEGIAILEEIRVKRDRIITGPSIYDFNIASDMYLRKHSKYSFFPFEHSLSDIEAMECKDKIFCLHGRLPVMVSAQCVSKSLGKCNNNNGVQKLTENGLSYYNLSRCKYCYSEMVSELPVSYFEYFGRLYGYGVRHYFLNLEYVCEDNIDLILNDVAKLLSGKLPHALKRKKTDGYIEKGVL